MTRQPIGILVAVAAIAATGTTTTGLRAAVASEEQSPAADTDSDMERLARKLTRRLGTDASDVGRVQVTTEGHVLEVVWELEDPADDRGATDRAARITRRAKLRRELRIVVRVLASQSVPADVTLIRAVATARDDPRGNNREHPILDAIFTATTFEALHADDLRLDDATLEELLGLAETATGVPTWGAPTTVQA